MTTTLAPSTPDDLLKALRQILLAQANVLDSSDPAQPMHSELSRNALEKDDETLAAEERLDRLANMIITDAKKAAIAEGDGSDSWRSYVPSSLRNVLHKAGY